MKGLRDRIEATLVTSRFTLGSLVFAALLAISGWCLARKVSAETVCADDIVPEGTAVIATGTTANCAGACRARETQAVCGPIVKICADQPIPKGYVVDSVTTMPACQCLGSENNGYVIRYIGTRDETGLSQDSGTAYGDSPYIDSEQKSLPDNEDATRLSEDATKRSLEARYPYGDPPFGNFLCAANATERQRYGNSLPGQSNNTNNYGLQPPAAALPQEPTLPPSWDYPASPLSSDYSAPPSWDYQRNEPFRVGQ
jgi:hypothetical protein